MSRWVSRLRSIFGAGCVPTHWHRCVCCDDSDSELDEDVVVFMNDPVANAPQGYPHNFIQTSKYSLITFLPLAMLFQLKKISNIYFLINMIFALIPGAAPISPFTSVAPFVFVLAVAMAKEAFEDVKRHRADSAANSRLVEVLREHQLVTLASKHVQVGDVVRVHNGEEVCADLVLLASSSSEHQAFIDTCNLDGETSLKLRKAIDATTSLSSVAAVQRTHAVLHTRPPSPELYAWNGYLVLDGVDYALSVDQLLYRGCILRNTDWVWGLVAYAGVDTKMFRNLKAKPIKTSTLDKKLNLLILVVFVLQNTCIVLAASLAYVWNRRHRSHWYLRYYIDEYVGARLWGYRYLTYFILFSYLIPISLFVTIELCKVVQAHWMRADAAMMEYMGGRWQHCVPNTSNLNEQLALVRLIFTDKTGTLTENVMRMRQGDIRGLHFDADDLAEVRRIIDDDKHPQHTDVLEYALALALCNTIQPFASPRATAAATESSNNNNDDSSRQPRRGRRDGATDSIDAAEHASEVAIAPAAASVFVNDTTTIASSATAVTTATATAAANDGGGGIVYEGSSPDEVALVQTAAAMSVRMVRRTTRSIVLHVGSDGREKTYNVLAVLPFSSVRKMMSIVVEDADTHRITLYNKGADSFLRTCLVGGNDRSTTTTLAAAADSLTAYAGSSRGSGGGNDGDGGGDGGGGGANDSTLAASATAGAASSSSSSSSSAAAMAAVVAAQRAHMLRADVTLNAMSCAGLRTLLVCSKALTRDAFDAWHARFAQASLALTHRDDRVDAACLEMERDLHLLGVSGIEDRLQEQVPETLSFFLAAGVVVWMLTGDKRETAVTIAATSTLLDPRVDFVDHVDVGGLDPTSAAAADKVREDLLVVQQHVALRDAALHRAAVVMGTRGALPPSSSSSAPPPPPPSSSLPSSSSRGRRCTFVIDGVAVDLAMRHHPALFLDVSLRVNSAVCCRLTPLQKAQVVRMFQKSSGLTALAIGDGANDVSMIQEGRVGVGILGLEGTQAALAADYAIPRFKHLRRLCAVHGRYSLFRNTRCITVSFYKNFVMAFTQFIFAFFVGFSGQTLYDGWLLTFYNIILTSIPPFLMGIFEKDLPEQALMTRPQLYAALSRGKYFNVSVACYWFVEAAVHAVLLFFVPYPTLVKMDATRHSVPGPLMGTTLFCGMLLVVLTRFGLEIRYWQWLQLLGMVVSVVLAILLVVVYSLLPSLLGDSQFYWQIYNLAATAKFWLYLIFWVGTTLFLDLTLLYVRKVYFPSDVDVAERQYIRRNHGKL